MIEVFDSSNKEIKPNKALLIPSGDKGSVHDATIGAKTIRSE
jgi:hypothetical protein